MKSVRALNFIILCLFVSLTPFIAKAQSQRQEGIPEIGKPMPDFLLGNVTHYKTKSVSLKDFKGKWLFLDFWFPGCIACIKSFKKISTFQELFKDNAQFLLVGMNNYDRDPKTIETLFEKLRVKQNLNIAVAYDSILFPQWNIHTMPHIMIIDPGGIVRYKTSGLDMTTEKIQTLINGEDVLLDPHGEIDRPGFDARKGSTSKDNIVEDSTIVYRSALAKWDGEKQEGWDILSYLQRAVSGLGMHPGFRVTRISLYQLYNLAYIGKYSWEGDSSLYGKYYPEPILEISDFSLFQSSWAGKGEGLYNYDLVIPRSRSNPDFVMRTMQSDLERVFGYKVSLEIRDMPVWRLIAKPGAVEMLRNKGEAYYFDGGSSGAGGFTARNFPYKDFFDRMVHFIGDHKTPFIDESGISGNIDIVFDCDMTNINDVRKALQKNGLDLVKGEKEMKVIVIRDPKN